jgi:hypothetical protein
VDDVTLPDTDSPEVMEQAICLILTDLIWEQASRSVHADDTEGAVIGLYQRVHQAVHAAHTGH